MLLDKINTSIFSPRSVLLHSWEYQANIQINTRQHPADSSCTHQRHQSTWSRKTDELFH